MGKELTPVKPSEACGEAGAVPPYLLTGHLLWRVLARVPTYAWKLEASTKTVGTLGAKREKVSNRFGIETGTILTVLVVELLLKFCWPGREAAKFGAFLIG